MVSPQGTIETANSAAARAFIRSLNILLKYSRLYGLEHARTEDQFQVTWKELCAAQPLDGPRGVLIGVTGTQLLLDGIPLPAGTAEKSLAQLMSSAGIGSIHFESRMVADDLRKLVRAFVVSGKNASTLAEQIKAEFCGKGPIKVNQVRFVKTDEGTVLTPLSPAAAQLAAKTLGENAGDLQEWLQDPHKLLQMIAAAEGSRSSSSGPGTGTGTASGSGFGTGSASASSPTGAIPAPSLDMATTAEFGYIPAYAPGAAGPGGVSLFPAAPGGGSAMGSGAASGVRGAGEGQPCACGFSDEIEALRAIGMLAQLGSKAAESGENASVGDLRQQLAEMPLDTQDVLRAALVSFATANQQEPDKPMLLQLAEHLAIRFAIDRFERGDVQVNSVREMLDRMAAEMDALRKVLRSHEHKMTQAGMTVETHADILDRQFWAAMPEKGKRAVLLSPDAWCIPPRNVADYVQELLGRSEQEQAERLLVNYAGCIQNGEAEARQKTAHGLTQMAELYARFPAVLQETMALVGDQLARESDGEMQRALSACFVRLSQEAVAQRKYIAVQQAMATVDEVEARLPDLAGHLRPRLGLLDRLPEFVTEAVSTPHPSPDLLEMLRCVPSATAEKFIKHFENCVRREECERLVTLMQQMGPAATDYLKEQLKSETPAQAVLSVGLLSRLDPALLERTLPRRLRTWSRFYQDIAIRQIAAGSSSARGALLLKLVDYVDPILLPQLIDEIGMSGDRQASARLMNLAFENAGNEYLRLKALEALGRLRETKAESHMRLLVEARNMWNWKHPRELRVASAQSLVMMDPAMQPFLVSKGIAPKELALGPLPVMEECRWARQRRYPRVLQGDNTMGTLSSAQKESRLRVSSLSLGGGLAQSDVKLTDGAAAGLELQAGLSKIRAQVWLREEQPRVFSFEITGIDLTERGKLRKLLAGDSWTVSATQMLEKQIAQPLRAALR